MTLNLVLLIVALVCFLAATFNVSSPRVSLIGAGLSLWLLAQILGAAGVVR